MTESNKLEYAEKNAVVNGIRLTYFERGLSFRTQKPTLLFLHATGFHARVWDKIIKGLGDYHIVAVDQRGHGRSEKRMIQHWHEFIADVEALIEHLDLTNIIGIGHSMGAHALIGAASTLQHRFNSLIAIDPVIPDESAFQEPLVDSTPPEEKHPTARRRREFDSPEAMAERLIDKGSYRVFDPEMFRDYCEYGLLPNPEGQGYVLACPPEIEASIYMSSRSNGKIYDAVRSIDLPVLILRAKAITKDRDPLDFSFSPTWPGLAAAFKRGKEIHFPENTHFLPMELPDRITAIIKNELKS